MMFHFFIPLVAVFYSLSFLVITTQGAPLAEIQEKRSLHVCAHPDALPFSSQNPTQPGFQLEIAETIAQHLNVQLQVNWIVFRRHARRADCDALIGAVVTLGGQKEEGRHGRMLLSKPYAGSGYVLMVSRESSGVYRFEDLKGSKIGVQHTSWPHYLLDTRKIPVASYLDPMEILEAIAKGEISAGLVPDPYVGWYLKQHPEGAVKIAEAYMPDTELRWNVAISLRNADEALREAVNQALNQMLATQMIQKIFAKYGVTYIPPFKE